MSRSRLTIPYPLILDGAMGTYYQSLEGKSGENIDLANLQDSKTVEKIHREYIDHGAQAIKTNTFGISALLAERQEDKAQAILQAAVLNAKKAARNTRTILMADIGPCRVPGPDAEKETARIYLWQLQRFYDMGIRFFLMETLFDDKGIAEAARWLSQQNDPCFLIVSFAVGADGMTLAGLPGKELLESAAALPGVNAAGFNCLVGPHHMKMLVKDLDFGYFRNKETLLYCAPNAGYPAVVGRRTVYNSSPDYYGDIMNSICHMGFSILGGCCGTTPADIEALTKTWFPHPDLNDQPAKRDEQTACTTRDSLWALLNKNRKVIAVELDPPKNDQIAAYMKNVSLLASSGADFVTIADCPIGRSRADSCLLACKIKRELGVLALPHMTCRDRNLNATKALLLGLAMEDIHSMLLVTGDPLPTDLRDEVKSVFSFNSRKLAAYIKGLYPETVSIPFNMFGALNVNALNFEKQLEIALEKEKAGISGFLTQPVLSSQALQNLKLARKKLKGKILGGIFPVVSYKNGLFLKNEVSGIDVSDEIIERYKGLDRSQGEDLALQISADIAAEIAPYVDGFYLMTPFSRVNLMVRLIDRIKKDGLLKKQL
mgnify:CR=1 FL=1